MNVEYLILTNIALALATKLHLPNEHQLDVREKKLSHGTGNRNMPLNISKLRDTTLIQKEWKQSSTNRIGNIIRRKREMQSSSLIGNGERVQFQVQGHAGPKSYIFGFDTGHGKNRQFRLEEKLQDGTVKGQYGYYDAEGKLKTVNYFAGPINGYREQHHKRNAR